MIECDHKSFTKCSRYWVCDNNFCFLNDDEFEQIKKV